MSKESGKGAHGGASKTQHKAPHVHRARKGPRCPACGRRMRRTLGATHTIGGQVWTPKHRDCQFQSGTTKRSILAAKAEAKRQAKAKYERARRKAIRTAKVKKETP